VGNGSPSPGGPIFTSRGLYDPCLSLRLGNRVVGNDIDANGKHLVMITGANQGGKSTLLRSVGLAQLMMQAGMFAPARSFTADICHGLFTHFKREEDDTMTSGKLDEELARMSDIAEQITPHSQLLCNESFASTNEREGSEIAWRERDPRHRGLRRELADPHHPHPQPVRRPTPHDRHRR
jgi:DNA mismatch repair ATPase MutS